MRKLSILLSILALSVCTAHAQLEDINPDYLKTLQGRTGKIVDQLGIEDTAKAARVQKIIIIQYYELSKIHDVRDADLEKAGDLEGEEREMAKEKVITEAEAKLYKRHAAYIAALSSELTQDQIEVVKDGMTYGVVQRTYSTYLNLLPDITEEQKRYIYTCLIEAREFAMDAGSSKAKHGWFGKYKGRINNYLSAQGIDMKKAEEDFKKREAKKNK